jgi:predicted Zn-dependent peptidase
LLNKKQILPRVNLTCINTGKFKTGCISINVIVPLNADTASKNALLPRVLCRGTSRHEDIDSLKEAMDELYGAVIEPTVRKISENQSFGLYAEFVDDDFVPGTDDILEQVTALMGEILLSPNTKGGLLKSQYVESEKKNLIDEIRAAVNDKIMYCLNRLTSLMCADEAYGVNKLGTEQSVAAITPVALTKHYHDVISTGRIEIIYCGSAKFDRVEAALLSALSQLPRSSVKQEPVPEMKLLPDSRQVRTFTDRMDVTQGKLTMGFRMGECMYSPNYAAMMVFNAVFGGSVTSKLFMNVREKLSLCYYASSMVNKTKGVMFVYSGVDFDKFEQAYNEILAQLDAIRRGDISEWEITSARRSVVTAIMTSLDSLYGIESLYFENAVNDIPISPEELAALADAVSVSDVTAVANSVMLDAVHYLKGKGDDVNEA